MMKSKSWIALATALIATLTTCPALAIDAAPATVSSEHLALLKQYRDDHVAAVLNGKPELVIQHYPENVRLMPAYEETLMGKATAAAYLRAFAARFLVKQYEREVIESLDLGPRIVEVGRFTMKLSQRSKGQEQDLIGRYLNVWEKQSDGTLSLMAEVWNYDRYIPISGELRFEEVLGVRVALGPHVPITDNISFELAALNKLMEAAVAEHDSRTWSLFYSDASMLVANQGSVNKGRQDIDAYFKAHAAQLPVFEKLDIRTDRIDVAGAYVIEYASAVAIWRNGDSSGVNTGKDLRIWRREADGSLKIFRHIGAYD
jgi:ketosteroid isomerase-like protein